jgi:hypothetical protein
MDKPPSFATRAREYAEERKDNTYLFYSTPL